MQLIVITFSLLYTIITQTPEWVYQNSDSKWPTKITTDISGNCYATGLLGASNSKGGVIKLNSQGNEKWIYLDDTMSVGYDVVVDYNYNVYIAGSTPPKSFTVVKLDTAGYRKWIYFNTPTEYYAEAKTIDVSPSLRIYAAGFTYVNSYDLMVVKLDTLGNKKWVHIYDGPGADYDEATCLAIDRDENIYVGGYSTGIGTSTDFTVIKLDSLGNEKWVYRYNGPANYRDEPEELALDTLGNVYIVGSSWGNEWDFCVIKLDPTGQEEWVYRYDGPANISDNAYDLTVDDSVNIYACGMAGGATTSLFVVIKIDSSGNEKWQYLSIGPYDTGGAANCISIDGLGGLYVGGGFRNASYLLQIVVVKLTLSGDSLWTYIHPHIPPSPHSDNTRDMVSDNTGNVYVTGKLQITSSNSDIIVLKFPAQVGAEEVKRENIIKSNNNTVSILRGGVEIQRQNNGCLKIYDILGKMIIKECLWQNKKYFFSLSPGVYFLKFNSEKTSETKKIIIL